MLHAFSLALAQLADPRVLRIWLKSMLVTMMLFLILGLAGWWLIDRSLAAAGLDEAHVTGADGLRGLLAFGGLVLGGLLLWRIIALAVLQLFADEVVAAVEDRHCPAAAAAAHKLGWDEELAISLTGVGRALFYNLLALPPALMLLITGVGAPLLFLIVNGLLLGRELQDMVWLRHRSRSPAVAAKDGMPLSGTERFILGGVIAALLLVPFVNFIAPFLGAAAAAHLIHRKADSVHVA